MSDRLPAVSIQPMLHRTRLNVLTGHGVSKPTFLRQQCVEDATGIGRTQRRPLAAGSPGPRLGPRSPYTTGMCVSG